MSRGVGTLLGVALSAIHGIGCVPDEASVATAVEPIHGGQLETGYPAVGEITRIAHLVSRLVGIAPLQLNGTNDRLWIQSSGLVTVQDEASSFANAQCFSSLEGAWFAL